MNKSTIHHVHPSELLTLWKKAVSQLWGGQSEWYDRSMREVFLLRTLLRRFKVEPEGVLYLGAHAGDLLWVWLLLGYRKVLMVEPQEEVFKLLSTVTRATSALTLVHDEFLGCEEETQLQLAQCAIGDHDGEADFFVMAHSMLSSLQQPKEAEDQQQQHLQAVPSTQRVKVPVMTLDSLLREVEEAGGDARYNTLYMNIQGAELKALKGARRTLQGIDFIYLEINFKERYVGAPTVEELNAFLAEYGFKPGWSMNYPTIGNGYIAYVKNR